jgi:hypothetical protein
MGATENPYWFAHEQRPARGGVCPARLRTMLRCPAVGNQEVRTYRVETTDTRSSVPGDTRRKNSSPSSLADLTRLGTRPLSRRAMPRFPTRLAPEQAVGKAGSRRGSPSKSASIRAAMMPRHVALQAQAASV